MEILFASLTFVLVAAAITFAGLKFYVRPKQALERVAGIEAVSAPEARPVHPSLALREVLTRLGSRLPASPKDLSRVQKRLIRAGFRATNAIRVLYGAKVVLALGLPLIGALALISVDVAGERKALLLAMLAFAGFIGPDKFVKFAGQKRQKEIRRGLPNALDLMVVCVESGLGLDQAILQVAKELEGAHPEISEEFALVNLELKAGKRRVEALRNLADRSAVDELKKLVAVLIQADRFGTGIAQSLRAHADYMRVQSRQVAEEKAAKLGVKLVFPIFFCILPALFVFTTGPVVVRIIRELIPAMKKH